MYNFEVKRVKSLSTAVRKLKVEGTQILGGGQTLIPTLKQRLASPTSLISIALIDKLKGISKKDSNEIVIGSNLV